MILIVFILYLGIVAYISTKYKLTLKLFNLNAILLLLLICLRGYDNGSVDTINYIDWVLNKANSMYAVADERGTIESGYAFYIHILQSFVENGTVFLFINTILSLLPLYYLVKKNSENLHISLFLFFLPLTNIHRMYFVCQRQILGLSIVLIGIILFTEIGKNYLKWIAIIISSAIAFTLQRFSILLPILFVAFYYVNINKKGYIGSIVVTLIAGVLLGGITNFSFLADIYLHVSEFHQLQRYAEAVIRDTNVNLMQAVVGSLLGVCFALYSKPSILNHIYGKMFLVSVIIFNLMSSVQEVYRIAGIFTIFGLIVLPKTLQFMIRQKKINLITISLWLTFAFSAYSYLKTLYAIDSGELPIATDSLVPYEFFWEDKYTY